MKLPSKKILIIIGICVVILAGAVVLKQKDLFLLLGGNKQAGNLNPTPETTGTLPLKSRDFYKDFIASTTPTSTPVSLTNKLSQDFFLNYVDLQNQGQWNTNSQALLIEKLSSTYATATISGIKPSDLRVFSDRETEKVHTFGNTVAGIVQNYNSGLKTSAIDLLSQVINSPNGSTTLSKKLAPLAQSYRLMVKDLKKVPAPASLAAIYTEVINNYSRLAVSIDDMSFYFSDPVRGFMGINNYETSLINQMNLLKNMADYFQSNGILFSNTEAGSIWNSLTQ